VKEATKAESVQLCPDMHQVAFQRLENFSIPLSRFKPSLIHKTNAGSVRLSNFNGSEVVRFAVLG
jgi:hypothetical protein